VLRDKPHAPAHATAREEVVRDLFDLIEEGPPIELPEPAAFGKWHNTLDHELGALPMSCCPAPRIAQR